MKKNKRQRFLSSVESGMYKFLLVVTVMLVVLIVFSETALARKNIDVQKLDKEVKEQQKVNDSLKMKIDEMTSLDNINEISQEFGLSYNSDNIRTIE